MRTTDLSGPNSSAFAGLTVRNILVLNDVVERWNRVDNVQIETEFSEHGTSYDETLNFVTDVGLIERGSEGYRVVRPVPKTPEVRRLWILEATVANANRYKDELLEYLSHYRVDGERLRYRPIHTRWSAEAPIRNFLLDLGAIRSTDDGAYELDASCYFLLGHTRSPIAMSPEQLRRALSSRAELGRRAEEYVCEYEKRRLGPKLMELVDHVAARDVTAGYDVSSRTITQSGEMLPRYIEVKACNETVEKFYWSANEVAVAKALGRAYFLYLVRPDEDGQFSDTNVLVIADAYCAVFEREAWAIESNVFRCVRRGRET